MRKKVRLTESELISLVRKVIKEQEGFDQLDDTPIEDEPSMDDEDMDDDIEDYGFDIEDELPDDEFQTKMRIKDKMRKERPASVGYGDSTRWDRDTEREIEKGGWSPIKPDDLPLDKFLKSKYNKSK